MALAGVTASSEVVTEDHNPSDNLTLAPSDSLTPRSSQSFDPIDEPKKSKKKSSLDFSKWPTEPSDQVLCDWLEFRKKKSLSVSQTVVNRQATELDIALKNGISVDDCLSECVVRGWQGFEYAWLSGEVKARAKSLSHFSAAANENSFASTGVITVNSSRKDVGQALLVGYGFWDLPENHRDDVVKEWRAGRLRVELINVLEKQNIAL
ncbi:hypothetical protein [Pseudoalteromonas obscura]|uniref:Uncharacterized protein n=1 Tax=Pseudoalteromonas obscura TaxID=3048491 RepID=A0ABT7EK49_9GAMM|nr:hypothetical protein [Pseudoalteromonas sp. P94(2023)]MDK2595423.1 hypothetical protein [Pseudoalteromonas sp. P94(2023)]